MNRPRVLAISGSTKSKSTSLTILRYIQHRYANDLDLHVYEDISGLPHFNPDHTAPPLPVPVAAIHKLIEQSDAVLFCTPEYVYSLPGSLKNVIEWCVSQTLFSGKPVAMIIAAASGQKAYESLSLILTTIECVLPEGSKLLIPGAKGKVGSERIDEMLGKDLDEVIKSLLVSLEHKGKPSKYE